MDSAFKGAAALAADDFSGKRITISVFIIVLFQTFFFSMLFNNCLSSFKILIAYYRLMVIFNEELVFFAMIVMPVEMLIGIGFLKNSIAGLFFIADHPADGCCVPTTAFLGWHLAAVKLIGDFVGAFTG